jgi:hypothetical protein
MRGQPLNLWGPAPGDFLKESTLKVEDKPALNKFEIDREATRWVYPRGGFGIGYQYG